MQMNRRDFLAYGAAGVAVVTAFGAREMLWGATARNASDVIYLGPDRIKVTRMAVGLGTYAGNLQRQLGLQGVADYLNFAFDQGQFFWDTADAYKTHPHIKQALKSVPREKVDDSDQNGRAYGRRNKKGSGPLPAGTGNGLHRYRSAARRAFAQMARGSKGRYGRAFRSARERHHPHPRCIRSFARSPAIGREDALVPRAVAGHQPGWYENGLHQPGHGHCGDAPIESGR